MATRSLMDPGERAMQGADETESAEGAARLLAALIPALAAAETNDGLPNRVRRELQQRVDDLLSIVAAYQEKFRAGL